MTCKDCLHYECCEALGITTRKYEHETCAGWVRLPCKVGDTLYEITSRNTISEYQVTAIRIEPFNIFIERKITRGFANKYIFKVPAEEIGKTVFLTREEAEKALEGKK